MMAGSSIEYRNRIETQAAAFVAIGREDRDTIRELLILDVHSSPIARQFFMDRLGSEAVLHVLLQTAVEDYSGDAQMTASYWVSQFPTAMLQPHRKTLETIASNDWGSVSFHARKALEMLDAIPTANN